ncbi:ubiquitin-specific protease ubp1 [Coemansia javaensis]|uniref:Ubiquitin carboxyl-terminal hydrolase n=1 Tax=Coemansia javaensis TaxID=2761396 RepID=A0A9W8HE02_9FUNG|nr:ubiquitin-specific protease ubp1 [Coemansia javaensis]
MWYHILGLYVAVVLGLVVVLVLQARPAASQQQQQQQALALARRGDDVARPLWVRAWRWVRFLARCGRRRKKRARPADDRREERRALRKQLREEAEEWLSEWIERIVELGDDLLEASFGEVGDDEDDDDDDPLAGDESDSDGGRGGGRDSGDERQAVYGLVNTGNSCFFNSVLQALASAEYLHSYLVSTLEHMDEANDAHDAATVSMPLTEALWETLTDLNAVVGRDSAFQPFAVMAALGSSRLNDREQQDAQEAFQLISAALSEERLAFAALQTPSLLRADLGAMLAQIDARRPHVFSVPRGLECVGSKGLSRVRALMKLATLAGRPAEGQSLTHGRREVLQNPFTGLTANRLSCVRCGYTEAVRHFAFDNVSLPLPLAATCTLDQALREYISLEELVDFQCRKCALGQTLRELIDELRRATAWLADNPEYDVAGPARPPPDSPRARRRAARAVAAWRRIVLGDPALDGTSTSDSGSEPELEPQYPIDPATQVVGGAPRLPPPLLADVPSIIQRLRADANEVARALRTDVERELPGIRLRKARNQVSTKQVVFAKLPPCLCLHLSRSTFTPDGYPVKNPCHVRFPEYLDFSPYTTTGNLRTQADESIIDAQPAPAPAPGSGGGGGGPRTGVAQSSRRVRDALDALGPGANIQTSYRLQAVVVHIGSHSYGHFITYRRKPRPPTRSGVNTPRYRSGSAVALPQLHAAAPGPHAPDRRLAPAAPPSASGDSSVAADPPADGVRRRRIVGGSANGCSSESGDSSGAPACAEYLQPAAGHPPARPKRAWRVADAMTAEWYLISDEDVQAVTLAEVLKANPYLLFYERVDGPQPSAYAGTPGILPSLSNLRSLARRSASMQPAQSAGPPPEADPTSISDSEGPALAAGERRAQALP